MIRPTDIRTRLRERPFHPFRVNLADGRRFEVRDPLWCMAADAILVIGIAPEDNPRSRLPESMEHVEYPQISSVEQLDAGPANSGESPMRKTPLFTAADIRKRIMERPFRPFRVRLTDGRSFDIHDPSWNLVADALLVVGIAPEGEPWSRLPERTEHIDYSLIAGVELCRHSFNSHRER